MPKIVDHETYKEALLTQCYEIFARRGYQGVTLRQLAEELGVSTGSLYHYFPTKQSILEAMFVLLTKQDVDRFDALFDPSGTLEEMLKVFFAFVEAREKYFQDLLLLTIDYFRHDEGKDTIAMLNQVIGTYREALAERSGLPRTLASMAIVFLNGLVYHRALYRGQVDFTEQCRIFTEMIILYAKDRNLINDKGYVR
ncbi:MAG TPA: TetR/AcrR family transcriptional regulator [Spirochaetota bacterium]|nr:TetR/AcrR family transcriptional regulator [Spirochaetota bacterium]